MDRAAKIALAAAGGLVVAALAAFAIRKRSGVALSSAGRRRIRRIVLHESVTRDVPRLLEVLEKRGLSVHYSVDRDGTVAEHVPASVTAHHGGPGHNADTIGIDVINPYYPRLEPDGRAIDAVWAHRGAYLVVPQVQAEATWQLVERLAKRHGVPLLWPGAMVNGEYHWGRSPTGREKDPGVHAHAEWGHADGHFISFYGALRARGIGSDRAYRLTMAAAQAASNRDRSTPLEAVA